MAAPWASGYRVRIMGKLHGQDCINVLHFATNTVANDNPSKDALILALLVALLQCVNDQLLPAVTSDYKLISLEGTRIFPDQGDPMVQLADPDANGTLSPTSASFIATLVQIKTGLGGKTHRGRFFLPPAGETNTANSVIDDAVLTQLTAFLTCVAGKFIGAGASTAYRVGVLSRKLLANSAANFDTAFTEATQLIPNRTAAIMGSRKLQRGS